MLATFACRADCATAPTPKTKTVKRANGRANGRIDSNLAFGAAKEVYGKCTQARNVRYCIFSNECPTGIALTCARIVMREAAVS